MLQKYSFRRGSLVLISLFCLVFGLQANEDDPSFTDTEKVVFHIDGLTVQERNALVHAFQEDQDLKIEYSCVPAGVLVVSRTETSTQDLNASISNILGNSTQGRISELTKIKSPRYF